MSPTEARQLKLVERFESLVNLLLEEAQGHPEFLAKLNGLSQDEAEPGLAQLLRVLWFHINWCASGGF